MSAPATTRSTVTQTIEKDRDPAWKDPKYADLLEQVISTASSQIDTVAQQYSHAIKEAEGRMQRSMLLADGIDKIRALLDGKIMEKFMKLQNSQLGFLTDNKQGYPVDVVRDCLIDALLIGVFPVGNEFNIIAGKTYVTQSGYKRLVHEIPGVEVLEDISGAPYAQEGKTKVRYCLKWRKDGATDELRDPEGKTGRVFVIRVNANMGDDAVIGKACRKAYKAAYEKIAGHAAPDGEVEGETADSPSAPPTTRTNLRGGNGNGTAKPEEKPADPAPAPTTASSDPTPDEADANWNDFTRDYQAAVNRGGVSDAIDIIDQWHATFAEHPKYKDQLFERMKQVESMQKAAPTAAPVASGSSKGKSKLF